MDGRAQAAYSTIFYRHWMYIMSGGDPARQAERSGRGLTTSDYRAIGEWVDKQFEKENVWCVFMPSAQFSSELVRGLEINASWRPVFMNDDQVIYANIKTQQGKELFLGIFTGQTKFPDEFSYLYTIGHNLLYLQDEEKVNKGCESVIEAFKQFPCQVVVLELMNASSHFPQFRSKITETFSQYFDDFINNRQTYIKQNGYREKLASAMLIADNLARLNSGNPKIAVKYTQHLKDFENDQSVINANSRW
jgi:hypothetical protein